MLYIVSTPIGNLSDITYRAVETLRTCDYILCEDTRHSLTLLQHYDIHKPLKSFHKFSEASKQDDILDDLASGLKIALISDAGTPGISDPGSKLIQACVEKGLPVTSIPGPCAAIAALCCSGLETERFQFMGFLPRKAGELRSCLQEILSSKATSICYESPNRLEAVLESLHELAPNRRLVIARELTKKFETISRGTASEMLEIWKDTPHKGEVVLLISAQSADEQTDWSELTPQQHVEFMQTTYGMEKQAAIKAVAALRGLKKRDVYNDLHKQH